MTYNPEIYLSSTLFAIILALLVAFGGAVFLLLRKKTARPGPGETRDWSIPALDACAHGTSLFHRWDPRVKFVTLFLYCFVVASLQTLFWSVIALLVSILACIVARIPMIRALRRLAAMAGFLSMFLLVMPFTSPLRKGEILVYLPFLQSFPFHGAGFLVALVVVGKACAIALMMEPLLATSPLPVTLQALSRIGLPEPICQMVLLVHRYIFVFLHEAGRIRRSMRVRGFQAKTGMETVKIMGNFFGMLFVRSFDRTQRVYEAMLSRGYNGVFPTFTHFAATAADWVIAFVWAMLALALFGLDRIVQNPLF